jgi:hypothetical protein
VAGNPEPDGGNQQSPDGDAETDRITTIKDLKTEQNRQAGVLDELLSIVKGGGQHTGTAHGQASGPAAPGQQPAALSDIKQAIRDVHAEDQAEADRAAGEAARKNPPGKEPEPEHTPREAAPTWKTRMQGALFGKEPAR